MPEHKGLKKLVRERMRLRGENYTTARARLLAEGRRPNEVAQRRTVDSRDGGTAVFPFERFTDRAKRVLSLTQLEAERSGHSYIGTEHLLLGLLDDDEGRAAAVLRHLGMQVEMVREKVRSAFAGSGPIPVRQLAPTTRLKRVVELAFEEAEQAGAGRVNSAHLLLGLLREGEGVGAQILADAGVGAENVRRVLLFPRMGSTAMERAGATGAFTTMEPQTSAAPLTSVAMMVRRFVIRATAISSERGETIGPEHVLLALAEVDDGVVQRVLSEYGLTRDAIADAVTRLHAEPVVDEEEDAD
jgi:ATP-dependent Clp protease ATP-binding subunit ClpA